MLPGAENENLSVYTVLIDSLNIFGKANVHVNFFLVVEDGFY